MTLQIALTLGLIGDLGPMWTLGGIYLPIFFPLFSLAVYGVFMIAM